MKAPEGCTTDPVYAVLDAITEGASPLIPWATKTMEDVVAQLDRESMRFTDSIIAYWDQTGFHFGSPVKVEVRGTFAPLTLCLNGLLDTYLAGSFTPAMLIPRRHPALSAAKIDWLQRAFTVPLESLAQPNIVLEVTPPKATAGKSSVGLDPDLLSKIFGAVTFIGFDAACDALDRAGTVFEHVWNCTDTGILIGLPIEQVSIPGDETAISDVSPASVHYPEFQFDRTTGTIHPIVGFVNSHLGAGLNMREAQWRALEWWVTPDDLLQGRTPLNALEAGLLDRDTACQILGIKGEKSC
ncbi:hypothetical protein B2J88_01730 [Rhodococcus sp. SRB_17]|nr:hypothetical protein [Rhodococcus sp. SRB_17]